MNASRRFFRWTLDVGRWTLDVFFFFLFFSPALFAQTTEPTSGYGPPTAVPPDVSITKPASLPKQNWIDQSQASADAKSVGCNQCHNGIEPMHKASHVVLGCTDCHGGNPARGLTKEQAHILPHNKEFWKTSANPPNSSVWLNHESPEFIRFINPGDLRVAKQACGLCHEAIIRNVDHSMMNHGAMLWGAALYNNGGFHLKNYRFGQAYGADGAPLRLNNYTPVTPEDTRVRGILPFLDPLPRFNLSNPGNILRIFEKGGEKQLQLGLPTLDEPPGQTDPPVIRARSRHAQPHRSGFPRPAKNAAARSAAWLPRLERSRGGLSFERLLRLSRGLRQRSFAHQLRLVEQVRPSGAQLHRGQDDSEKRTRPPGHSSVHALDSIEPVHELPHAPGQSLRESVSRLHLVGPGDRRRIHVSEGTAEPDRRRAGDRNPKQSGGGGRERSLGRQGFSRQGFGAKSASSRTRSLPTITGTAGSSAPSSSTIAKAICSTCATTKSPTTIRKNSPRPST